LSKFKFPFVSWFP